MNVRMAFFALFFCASLSVFGADSKPAEQPSKPADDSKPTAKVGEEARKLLETKMNISVRDMQLQLAMDWYKKLSGDGIPVFVSEGAAKKKVTLELVDASWAEALRKISTQTGVQYRVVKGEIRLATPEEFAAIDAGKAEFKAAKNE